MFNLVQIIEFISYIVIVLSGWGLYYFIARIISTRRRWEDDIEPLSLEELVRRHAMENDSPTDETSPRHGK